MCLQSVRAQHKYTLCQLLVFKAELICPDSRPIQATYAQLSAHKYQTFYETDNLPEITILTCLSLPAQVDDAQKHATQVAAQHPLGTPIFLGGQSLGGLIDALLALR